MLKRAKKISNPLTVIAVFAGLTEVVATALLSLVSEQNQFIVLVFLLAFPCLLVVLFFITLNFNNKVLYAPSDYADETNFMTMMDKQLNEVEERITLTVEKELNEKVSELEDNLSQKDILKRVRKLIKNDQYDEALDEVNGALDIRLTGIAIVLKANILSRRLDYRRAIDVCTQGLELSNNNSSVTATLYWNRACYKSLNHNNVDSILEDLEEAVLHNLEFSEKLHSDEDLAFVKDNSKFIAFAKRFSD